RDCAGPVRMGLLLDLPYPASSLTFSSVRCQYGADESDRPLGTPLPSRMSDETICGAVCVSVGGVAWQAASARARPATSMPVRVESCLGIVFPSGLRPPRQRHDLGERVLRIVVLDRERPRDPVP